ncbi:MAG TPA: hypothetical protein VFH39_04765 [Candidatus Saccharimonadales bacterium]|nr:hypothetical protein [Candidatus Saccharimonadales bacterium]
MSEIASREHQVAYHEGYETAERTSGWVGWVGFGGFMMILAGILHVLDGLVGLYRSSFYLVTNHSTELLLFPNVRAWAWVNLIAGAVVILAGVALFSGAMWARVLAVILSIIVVAGNVLAITLYPLWSIIAIALAILVIYAVTVHGGELRHE